MRPVFLPVSLDELWEILSDHPEAALYAGGTDLLVRVGKRLSSPPALVCLERIGSLKGVREEGNRVWLGACSTHTRLLENPLIRRHFPVLTKALETLGSPHIRNMGTIGGNIVTASPAGDTLPPLYVLGAQLEIRSASSTRFISIADFVKGPGKTDLSRGEIVTGVWLNKEPAYRIHHYEKVGQRNAQAIAVVNMAALLDLSGTGRIEKARLSWGSVGPTVISSVAVENFLMGKYLSADVLTEAAPLVQTAVRPIDDVRASASYRREVSGNLLMRLLECM
ncbi:MAG: xanthine dehydrogenase family protein subunit M [Desulfobacteraceae bacterium]|nr:MAG: xanthine dehydrogenase family protein subunit M [Desulfobacteraceae bacterium]